MSAARGRRRAAAPPDHAGSTLCRLLVDHPEVTAVEILGQDETDDGTITYWLAVSLPDGRQLLIDVEDAGQAATARRPA